MKYNREKLPKSRLDIVPFWGGEFSNWAIAPFTLDEQEYTSVEQHMMRTKALEFGDHEAMKNIMWTNDPREQKAMGRRVVGFDPAHWREVCYVRCIPAVFAKFDQNEDMRDYMLNTGDKVLIEASPTDRIWGIGRTTDDPRCEFVDAWDGDNLLGFMLMEVRDQIRDKYSK